MHFLISSSQELSEIAIIICILHIRNQKLRVVKRKTLSEVMEQLGAGVWMAI